MSRRLTFSLSFSIVAITLSALSLLIPSLSSAQTSGATYSWTISSWGACSSSTQTRTVICNKNVGNFITVADDSMCPIPKPVTTASCSVSTNVNGALPASDYTWVEAKKDLNNNARWRVAMSDDGQVIVSPVASSNDYPSTGIYGYAGHIDISKNGGSSFQKLIGGVGPGTRQWRAVELTPDAKKMVAIVDTEHPDGYDASASRRNSEQTDMTFGYLYTSNDSGATWTRRDSAGRSGWGNVALSTDGNVIFAGNNSDGKLRLSKDAGNTWQVLSTNFYALGGGPGSTGGGAVMNGDGTQLVAIATTRDRFPPEWQVQISRDGGATWQKSLSITDTSANTHMYLYSSRSGQDLTAMITDAMPDGVSPKSKIYVSHDAGRNWTLAYTQKNVFRGGAMSADGKTIVAVGHAWDWYKNSNNFYPDGILYHAVTSIDGGLTWQSNILPKWYLNGAAISADGKKIVIVNTGGGIWIGTRGGLALPVITQDTSISSDSVVRTTTPVTTTPASNPPVSITPSTPTPPVSTGTACVNLRYSIGPDDTDAETGGDVTRLQQFLAQSVGYTGAITGRAGPLTVKAIQTWQRTNGLISSGDPESTGYGYVGPKTRAVMACRSATVPPPTTTESSATPTTASSDSLIQSLLDQIAALKATIGGASTTATPVTPAPVTTPATPTTPTTPNTPNTPAVASSCTFNGIGVASGSSVTAYGASTVPSGSICAPETRTCTNGVLSGSYTNASCRMSGSATSVPAYAVYGVLSERSETGSFALTINGDVKNAVLVISTEEPAAWFINTTGGATFQRVIVFAGVGKPNIYGLPGVPVEYHGSFPTDKTFFGALFIDGKWNELKEWLSLRGMALVGSPSPYPGYTYSFTLNTDSTGVTVTPTVVTATCSFNGSTIASGKTVIAYRVASVPAGSSCLPEMTLRTCRNGTLSGTYGYASCTVAAAGTTITPTTAASCAWNGSTVASGASVKAYLASTVPSGSTCTSQTRTCTNGTLSGTYGYGSCSVGTSVVTPTTAAASCTHNGATIAHGASVTRYQASSAPYGSSCVSQSRTCSNGTLSGSYTNTSCSVSAAPTPTPITYASCTLNGATIAHGASVTRYQASAVPDGSSCVFEARICNNGTLSGSYTNTSCSAAAPPTSSSCSFNGSTVSNGASITAYQASSVAYGSSCISQTRSCSNGTLSGSYTSSSCSVGSATSCTFNGATVANGASITAYQSSSAAYGTSCVSQTRSCSNGTLSGSYANSACSVTSAASCAFNGQTIAHGAGVTAYASETEEGYSCTGSETRYCVNGTLTGSYVYPSCTAYNTGFDEGGRGSASAGDGYANVANALTSLENMLKGLFSKSAAPANACPALTRTLALWNRGEEVSSLQQFLVQAGLLSEDAVTGNFGPQTENALKVWQKREGVVTNGTAAETGWGVTGPKTRAAITRSCS